jgi:transcriptional regulator with GAF, ATPase, and Fis domain
MRTLIVLSLHSRIRFMRPKLEAIAGPMKGATLYLTDELSLGENSDYGVSLDSSFGGLRCLIKRENGLFKLCSSENQQSVLVNRHPVTEQVLRSGDEISIGESVFVVALPEDASTDCDSAKKGEPELAPGSAVFYNLDELLPFKGLPAAARLKSPDSAGNEVFLRACRAVSSIQDLDDLEHHLVRLISDCVPAERGVILLKGQVEGEFAAVTGWDKRSDTERPVKDSRQIIECVLREGVAIVSNHTAGGVAEQIEKDTSASPDESGEPCVRAFLAVPLEVFGAVRGVIYADTCDPGVRFDVEQLRQLASLGGLAALALENARRLRWLEVENQRLQAEIGVEHHMVGNSPRIREVHRFIGKVGPMDATTLIYGESGTGKELAARAIHDNSPRAAKPFVAINCAALPENLLESELFGYEKGAFTGAIAQKKGRFEIAEGGTVFLDEIGEIALTLQPKLLRVLQQRELDRLGGTRTIPVNVRIIAATNRYLADAVQNKTFRQDLYYRLNVVSLTLPPLRERRDDILQLADYFLKKFAAKANRQIAGFSREARACLEAYDWPGNIRELENALERAVALGSSELILPEDLPEPLLERAGSSKVGGYHDAVAEAKRRLITKALQENAGNYTHAAKALGLQPTYLHRLLRNLNLKPETARQS